LVLRCQNQNGVFVTDASGISFLRKIIEINLPFFPQKASNKKNEQDINFHSLYWQKRYGPEIS
jgi:hypothetical protein